MNHSTGKPTKKQKARLDALSQMFCIACVIEGCRQPSRTEVHHIVDKGYRVHSGGHDATLPLCSWHHRTECAHGLTTSEMVFRYGPSLAGHKRRFIETYGTERELLETVNGLLARVA